MSLEQKITDLLALAKDVGGAVYISINIPMPANAQIGNKGDPVAPTPSAVPPETATKRTVLWALNLLKGAPGQPNQDLVRAFLWHKGWIGPTDQPVDWRLETVPVTKAELATIYAQLREFEKTSKPPKLFRSLYDH
jgi:hypothetical protein